MGVAPGEPVVLDKEFGYVLVVGAIIAFQIVLHGFRFGSGSRKVFTAEYYRQPAVKQLAEEHKKAFGTDKLPSNGYPDTGNGRYADLLSYADWFKMNSYQRAHQNGLENIPSVLAFLFIGGLFFPIFVAGCGVTYIIGREFYAAGYAARGPSGRLIGATLVDLALLALFGAAILGGVQFSGLATLPAIPKLF